jgi:hypothetical protein
MFDPGNYSESETLAGYLEAQLVAIRAAAYGLTEEQARATPCRSALSIGGLVKHAVYVMQQREQPDVTFDEAGFARYSGSFALTADETLAGVLETFDRAVERYLDGVRATDPAAGMTAPPAPWDGRDGPTPSVQRYALVHHVEEFARHAGHADIIREQLDGAGSGPLLLATEGRPGNAFMQPWSPAAT